MQTVDGFNNLNPQFLGNYKYLWYDGSSVIPANIRAETTPVLSTTLQGYAAANPSSDYTVLITSNLTGCQNNQSVKVTDASMNPTLSIAVIKNNTVCAPNFVTLFPDGELKASVFFNGVGVGSPLENC